MYLYEDVELNNYVHNNDLNINIKNNEDKVNIKLSKNIEIVTPVLKAIYKNNYNLTTERVFYDE